MKLLEIYREMLKSQPKLAEKYTHFCEWRDGRLIAVNISTGKYSGTLPTELSQIREFNESRKNDGTVLTTQVINFKDQLNIPNWRFNKIRSGSASSR